MMMADDKYSDKKNGNFRNVMTKFNLMDPCCKRFKTRKKNVETTSTKRKRIACVGALRIHTNVLSV